MCDSNLMADLPQAAGRLDSSPPVNFAIVSEGLYRSGYPQAQDYPFMQSLKLKTIVTLVRKELPDGYQEFMQVNRITHKIFDMAGTKKEDIPVEMMRAIHAVVSEPENYPLLIHCNHGKHRTGCVVGVFRKSNQWDLKRIIDEYSTFAEPKVRETDLRYLTDFELTTLWRQPQEVALRATTGRFVRLVIAVIFILVVFYPLTKLRVQESRPNSS
ncbi:tyrosine phosphatase family-domain-containing protein [Nemania serpens]|nr:tyrosine phosphatase family-domain-containing protein [Nemania serpens]